MRILVGILVLFFMVGQADAQARAAKHGPRGPKITLDEEKTPEAVSDAEDVARRVFSEVERRIIERYFGKDEEKETTKDAKGKAKGKSKGLPPGLAKRDTLPPGLARQVRVHGTLPPGLQKRDLPDDLESLLPERADTEARVIIDDDVVLIDRATGLILDIIEDVIIGSGQEGSGDQ